MGGPTRTDPGAGLCPSLWKVYIRSLTLQASWNPRRMQNLGLVFILLPWLRCRDTGAKEIRRFCRRHFSYFNTNPYLANYIVGGVLRLEEQAAAGRDDRRRKVEIYKRSLGQALASLGDQIFWLGLQPSLLLIACLIALLGHPLWAVSLVAAFGVSELVLRFVSLKAGYALGMDIVDLLGSPNWHRFIRWAGRAGSIAAGGLLAFMVAPDNLAPDIDSWHSAAFGCIVLTAVLLRRRLPGESIVLLLLPVALFLAIVP